MDITSYRASVSACRRCPSVCAAPRFGTGKLGVASVAIVGQNPPVDKDRCLHGAWMLHYQGEAWDAKKRSHEKLMLELVTYLGLTIDDVWATNATKCPTFDNSMPYYWETAHPCMMKFLRVELEAVQPRVVLAFGYQTGRLVADAYNAMEKRMAWLTGEWPTVSTGLSRKSPVMGWKHVLECPHPSIVDRFITKESWLEAIRQGFEVAKTQAAPALTKG